ncbi:MAG: hypothetical protein [Bacteriophage sp.]|nr:MAG: hypothetical protein [Bacteriophage sp.]
MTDYSKVLSENVKEYFLNEHTSENEFKSMNQTERMQNLAEYALTEYANTAKIIDAVFKGNNEITLAGIGKDVSNSAFFKDIERSNGDITKTKHNNDLKDLLNYGLYVNSTTAYKSNGTAAFNTNAVEILLAINYFEMNKRGFKDLINKESTILNNKQIASSFYKSMVFLIQMAGDILYSNSLKAKFNYNNDKNPTVTNVYYEYDSAAVDEMMEIIIYLNSAFRNGKIFKSLDPTLQEAYNDTLDRITLNEGVIDSVFGIINYFKTLDLLILWPIYITRAVTYWVGYFYLTFKNIALDIDQSIAMKKATVLTRDEINSYHDKVMVKGQKAKQAFLKADSTIDLNIKEDKKSLTNLQTTTSGMLI